MRYVVILAPPVLIYLFLLFRISAFRKDIEWEDKARGYKPYFKRPHDSVVAVFQGENYTDQGRGLLPWLWVSVLTLGAAVILAATWLSRAT